VCLFTHNSLPQAHFAWAQISDPSRRAGVPAHAIAHRPAAGPAGRREKGL